MNFSRKTILVVGAALLAACGDKVTVQEYTPPAATPATPKVNSVSVAPANATLNVGQSITMTAAVNADAGLATTVTWSSSDATKASVSAAGVVTGVAVTPGVAICATSTVDTGKKGCASIVVQAATVTTPASISIASITNYSGQAIVNNNVSDRIVVTLNVLPGSQTVSKVVLLVGGARVDSQTFTAAQSAALRYAADEAAAAQTAFPQVAFTVATDAFNATTGVPTFPNGVKAVAAQLYTSASTTAATATAAQNLTFNNSDKVYGTFTLPSTKVQAQDDVGYQWTSLGGGKLQLSVIPVIYSGKTPSSATIKYSAFHTTDKVSCAAKSTAGAASSACFNTTFGDTATVKTLATFPGTVEFGLWDMDYIRSLGVPTPRKPTVNMIFSDGTAIADSSLGEPVGTTLALRIDNRAPNAVSLTTPSNSTTNYFRSTFKWDLKVNAAVDTLALISALGVDSGVSVNHSNTSLNGLSWKVYVSGVYPVSTDSLSPGTTAVTSMAGLSDGNYCLRIQTFDKLGNGTLYPESQIKTAGGAVSTTTCPTVTGFQTRKIWVDNTAPTVAFAGVDNGDYSAADTAISSNFTAGTINYFYQVTEANRLTDSISVCTYKNVSSVMTAYEYIGGGSSTACGRRVAATGTGTNKPFTTETLQLTNLAYNLPTYVASTATQIVITAQIYDAAGNKSDKITRVVLYDSTAPTASDATAGAVSPGGTSSVASFLNDNMSVYGYALESAQNTAVSGGLNDATSALAFGGNYTTSEGTGYAVLREGYTEYGEKLSTVPYGKFLNQSATATAPAYQYLLKWGSTIAGSSAQASAALASMAVAYRVKAVDQVGTYSTNGVFTQPSITNGLTILTKAVGASPIAGGSGAITTIALDPGYSYSTDYAASSSALSGNRVLSSNVRIKVTYYAKHDLTSTYWNGKDSATGWVYCNARAGTDAGSPMMTGASDRSAVGEGSGASIRAVAAPNVYLYLPVSNGGITPTFQYYGKAAATTSTTVTGTPKNGCGDLITTLYTITLAPGQKSFPYQNYTSGSALWVVEHGAGFASVFPMGIGYNR